VLEGIEADDLNAGPGHLPGSVLPGERGNSIVSGHRDRHFNHFDALKVGDTVVTESRIGQTTWVIVAQRIVDKDDPALFRTSDATLTLTTCWPIRYLGSAPSRLIVTAKPVGRGAARLASAD
jgi:sortase A